MEDQLIDYIVLGVVLFLCLGFIARGAWRKLGPGADDCGCGGCGGCSDAPDNTDPTSAPPQGTV